MDYWLVGLCGLVLLLGVYTIYKYFVAQQCILPEIKKELDPEIKRALKHALRSVPLPNPRLHFSNLSVTTSLHFKQMSVGGVTDPIYKYMKNLERSFGESLHIITFRETDRVHKALCKKHEIYHDFAESMFHSTDVNYNLHKTKMTDCSKELAEAFHELNNIANVKEYEDFFNTYDVEVCKQLEALKSGDEEIFEESVKKAQQCYDLLGRGNITKK